MDEPAQTTEMPLFARVIASLAAHLAGALTGLIVHWLVWGWVELDQVAQASMVALALGCGVAGAEALARAGWLRAALLLGGLAGPVAGFGATWLSLRLRADAFEALSETGLALTAAPVALLQAGTAVLFAAAWIGPLVHHRLRGSPPTTQAAGMSLAALTVCLGIVPPGLGDPLWGSNLRLRLAELAPWAAALALVPRLLPPAEVVTGWLTGRLGLAPPVELPLADWVERLRRAVRWRAPFPASEIERRAREVTLSQGHVVWACALLLLAAAQIDLFIWGANAVAPTEVTAVRWRIGPRLDQRLTFSVIRGAMLAVMVAALVILRARSEQWSHERRAWRWAAAWLLVHLVLLLGLSDVNRAMLGATLLLGLGLAALAVGVIPPSLGVVLMAVVPALVAWEHLVAWESGFRLNFLLPGHPRSTPAVLAWGLGALLVIGVSGWRWGVPLGRMLAVGAAGLAAAAPAAGPLFRELRGDWVDAGPTEVWAAALVAGLAGGAVGAALARRWPRAAPASLLALVAASLAALPPLAAPDPPQPEAERVEALRRGAEADEPEAMHRWGCLLVRRWQVRIDRAAARRWIEAAAAAGHSGARERLAWDPELSEAGPAID